VKWGERVASRGLHDILNIELCFEGGRENHLRRVELPTIYVKAE
jgi:hypothetical protein